jgi:hypothetical protein
MKNGGWRCGGMVTNRRIDGGGDVSGSKQKCNENLTLTLLAPLLYIKVVG